MPVEPSDLLRIDFEEDFETDSQLMALRSRYFDWHILFRFDPRVRVPQREATNIVLAALDRLLRSFADAPFDISITRPLVIQTLTQLAPHIEHRIIQASEYYNRRVIVRPPRPIYSRSGEFARQHMDDLERAFARQRNEGGRVNLTTGSVTTGTIPSFRDLITQVQRNSRPNPFETLMDAFFEDAMSADQVAHNLGFSVEDRPEVRRARETLLHCLSPEQRVEFETTGYFTVLAQDGRRYRITKRHNFNVEDNSYVYCCVPQDNLPVYDKMLASKLWLEADFARFMATANRRPKNSMDPVSPLDRLQRAYRDRLRIRPGFGRRFD